MAHVCEEHKVLVLTAVVEMVSFKFLLIVLSVPFPKNVTIVIVSVTIDLLQSMH